MQLQENKATNLALAVRDPSAWVPAYRTTI